MDGRKKFPTGGTISWPPALLGDTDAPEYVIPPANLDRLLLQSEGLKHVTAHDPKTAPVILTSDEVMEVLKNHGKGKEGHKEGA